MTVAVYRNFAGLTSHFLYNPGDFNETLTWTDLHVCDSMIDCCLRWLFNRAVADDSAEHKQRTQRTTQPGGTGDLTFGNSLRFQNERKSHDT